MQKDKRVLTKSASTSVDFARIVSDISEEDKKIDEALSLIAKREPRGKKAFACWHCKEFGHFSYQCPKRERKVKPKKPYKSKITKDCFFVDEDDEFDFKDINFLDSDDEDEIVFVAIKEESPVKEEKRLVSHVEKK